jgi:leucyl aminopeptidase
LCQLITEGALLGTYRFLKFKTKEEEIQPQKKIDFITLLMQPNPAAKAAVDKARIYAEATAFARDLVNEPANTLNPEVLAEIAKKVAEESGLEFRVIEAPELKKLGAGAILGVGGGSKVPPCLIQLTYRCGKKNAKRTALVGKGITFDSGGLSLKPSKSMETMKCDMAGAAAVLCAMKAMPKIAPGQDVIGILCAAENMPSGSSVRPGDVLNAMNGKSVEIINTDAEGRLILGDGLWYARKLGATHLVDVATLTGAVVVALGKLTSGLFGTPDAWVEQVRRVANAAGDRAWPMPIFDDYREQLKSEIADFTNTGGRPAGSITAALFLKEFTGGLPWVHMDIAGTAWAEDARPFMPKGATGVAVRTLAELAFQKFDA